ncbi:MAG: iron-sulfur cluster assembly scaffold protein [Novosphingobium sp.]
MSTAKLYNAELLGLATALANYPLDEKLPLRGSARSPACGSVVEVGLLPDADGAISQVGIKAQACAVGQAAAAIFAAEACGMDEAGIATALGEIEQWLAGGDLPHWNGLAAIAAARDYPARHAAILLPWRAALVALAARG